MRSIRSSVFAICCLAFQWAAAQSISIVELDLNPSGDVNESLIQSQGLVENTSANTLDVKVRRITVDTVPGTQNYFCWVQCYEPETSQSPTALSMEAGAQSNSFYADYKPRGNAGVSTLTYCFYDVDNESDSTCVTVRFSANPTGVEDVFMGHESGISASYPNPARTVAHVNYALRQGWQRAEVAVYSMLGQRVMDVRLQADQGTLALDVADLPAGMYVYSLVVDGSVVQTRRMIIAE